MIIVRLAGGIANQLFPYAMGRHLAHKLGTELKLDISGFHVYENRKDIAFRRYALSAFNIVERFSSPEEVKALTVRDKNLLERLFRKKAGHPSSYIKEKQHHFDPSILELKGDLYLEGNWNSPKYFEDIDPMIRNDFTFREPPSERNLELIDRINSVKAVSIHVRRGDYVWNAKINSYHGVCSLEYYQRAAKYMADHIESPHFFVFSDDPDWVRGNMHLDWPMTIVDHNGPPQEHEDMRLMSLCPHNIIANSGFSWWAAWLNKYPAKMAIAPDRWFVVTKHDVSTLVPSNWIRM
jgi:hypothetical protein